MNRNIDIPPLLPSLRDILSTVSIIVLCAFWGVAGYWVGSERCPEAVAVTRMPEVRQADGSVVAAREPAAAADAKLPQLPKGATPKRQVATTIKPKNCDPVPVTVTLVDTPAGSRAIVQSEGNEILGAVDLVFTPDVIKPSRPYAAGVHYDLLDDRYGAWVTRDIGRMRVGAELFENDRAGIGAALTVGFTFGL